MASEIKARFVIGWYNATPKGAGHRYSHKYSSDMLTGEHVCNCGSTLKSRSPDGRKLTKELSSVWYDAIIDVSGYKEPLRH